MAGPINRVLCVTYPFVREGVRQIHSAITEYKGWRSPLTAGYVVKCAQIVEIDNILGLWNRAELSVSLDDREWYVGHARQLFYIMLFQGLLEERNHAHTIDKFRITFGQRYSCEDALTLLTRLD